MKRVILYSLALLALAGLACLVVPTQSIAAQGGESLKNAEEHYDGGKTTPAPATEQPAPREPSPTNESFAQNETQGDALSTLATHLNELASQTGTLRDAQLRLGEEASHIEQEYATGLKEVKEALSQTQSPSLRRAQRHLYYALARERTTLQQEARQAGGRVRVALTRAGDIAHAEQTLEVATRLGERRQTLLGLVEQVNAAAREFRARTGSLIRQVVEEVQRRTAATHGA